MIVTVTLNPAVDKIFYIKGLRKGEVNRASKIYVSAGSKGINVSRVLNVMGKKSVALGFAGGPIGEILINDLKKDNVIYDYVSTNGNTRMNTKIIDIEDMSFTEFNEKGYMVSEQEFEFLISKLEKLAKKSKHITLGGTIPPGLPKNSYSILINRIRKYNTKIYLDCGGELLADGIKARPNFVKPNLEEFNDMIGIECKTLIQAADHCKKVIDMGIESLMITQGPDGALAVEGDKMYLIKVPKVKAISTVGAGDSFLAGFLYAKDNNLKYEDCLRHAASCSVAKVCQEDSSIPSKDILLSYLDKIEITRI